MATNASPVGDDRPERISAALVSEIKAEMGRQDIAAATLARMIGENKQYVSSRLTAGNPHTGKRVPLSMPDIAAIASALHLSPRELVARAERGAGIDSWD